jgi:hypothetical protein
MQISLGADIMHEHSPLDDSGAIDMSDLSIYKELRDKYDVLFLECSRLREENAALKASGRNDSGMTDYQYRQLIEMICQIIKANIEAGMSSEEILKIIAALKNENP